MEINARAVTKATRVGDRAQALLAQIAVYLETYDLDVMNFGGAYAPDPNHDLLHNLSTAKMISFVFADGPMHAPTGLKLTVLGQVTYLAVQLIEQAGQPQQTPVKPKREYAVDGSNGKFHLRESVDTVLQGTEPVTTFPTRKQAEHVAALLNAALAC